MFKGYEYYFHNLYQLISKKYFKGWGRKRTGRMALWCYEQLGGKLRLLEDGFIRSVGLGVESSPSFSLVEDCLGIYYDATTPSKLENILNSYDFETDNKLMKKTFAAMELIKVYHISKYNNAPDIDNTYFNNKDDRRVLVIAQTAGDASLKYGMGETYSTDEMIQAAVSENPDATVYLKIHPDVLSGKKKSDIDLDQARKECVIIDQDVNPISLLKHFDKVYTKTSQMGFEALLVGCECVCFGMPFYAGWGITDDRVSCERRQRKLTVEQIFAAAYILYTRYYNPYTKKETDIIDTIKTIAKYRERDRSIKAHAYFFGFSTWKHTFMMPFVKNIKQISFINPLFKREHLLKAQKKGLTSGDRVYIWGKKEFDELEAYAAKYNSPVYRVEDGFIRSVGLGSDLTQPYSLVIDSRGIYFDPTRESDLEHLLNFYQFDKDELERAEALRNYLIEKKLSKYNNYDNKVLSLPKNKKIVLVPGQVEDDASIKFGADGMTNLELLESARKNAPDAYIIYKPHPDVLVGNRVGHIDQSVALRYCDKIVTEVGIDSVLSLCDEVHTMTSLVGFEAIMRGIKVYTYGLPFYAGWGLSIDQRTCERRKRVLNVNELTAATLLLYPRYIDPETKELCEVEVTLAGLEKEKERLSSSYVYRSWIKMRNFVSRKSQLIMQFLKS